MTATNCVLTTPEAAAAASAPSKSKKRRHLKIVRLALTSWVSSNKVRGGVECTSGVDSKQEG
jgi:hypothetical protein